MANMAQYKRRLTNIKKQIAGSMPSEGDILGFEGVTRELIESIVDNVYTYICSFDNIEDNYDLVLLRRRLKCDFDFFIEYLSKSPDSHFQKDEKFESFLNRIFDLKVFLKSVYISVFDNPLRTEEELIKGKEQLNELSVLISKLSESQSVAESKFTDVDNLHSELMLRDKDIGEVVSKCEEVVEHYDESIERINTLKQERQTLKDAIDTLLDTTKELQKNTKSSLEEAKELGEYSQDLKLDLDDKSKVLENLVSKNEENQEEIDAILEDANRASMAGSFRERFKELDKPLKWSEWTRNISLLAILGISVYLFNDHILSGEKFEPGLWLTIILKFAVISPLVWIAWSASKKYGFLSRIREDYAYKYASAVAFEGYHRKASEVDEALKYKLLEISLDNFGENPVRLFDAENIHGSPMHEGIGNASGVLKNVNPFKKEKSQVNGKVKADIED